MTGAFQISIQKERLRHLSQAIKHLDAAGMIEEARSARQEMDLLTQRPGSPVLQGGEDVKVDLRRTIGAVKDCARHQHLKKSDINEMAHFGVRLGAIVWLPAALNTYECDLGLWRELENLADRGATRRTRKLGTAIQSLGEAERVFDHGWTGFVVEIEIAHSEEDYGYVPHWSDYAIHTVYVDHPYQALRIAKVLRDRQVISQGTPWGGRVDPQYLWNTYSKNPYPHKSFPIEL